MSTEEENNQLRKDRDLAAEGVRYLAGEKKRLLVELSELRSENKRLAERLAELEEHAKQVSFAVGMCEVVDEEVGPIGPSAPGDVLAEVRRLFARDVELSAPPVVPEGWDPDDLEFLAPVFDECERAMAKFPTWPTDPQHAYGVLAEEFGELGKAILQAIYEPHKSTPDDVRTEAIQTAAMAVRFIRSLDRYKYTPCPQHDQRPPHAGDKP